MNIILGIVLNSEDLELGRKLLVAQITKSMMGENRLLVTNEPVEVHQDFRKITDHFRGIYRIYPNLIKEKPEDVNM